jgi:hypothetical protein
MAFVYGERSRPRGGNKTGESDGISVASKYSTGIRSPVLVVDFSVITKYTGSL